jgi:hypothetical protein
MNGADLADVNNDGMLELVSISYDQTFSPTDSTIINVYALEVPCTNSTVLFGTYKGSNTRDGLITNGSSSISIETHASLNQTILNVYPNPNFGMFTIELNQKAKIEIFNSLGVLIYNAFFEKGKHTLSLGLADGIYLLKFTNNKASKSLKLVIQK